MPVRCCVVLLALLCAACSDATNSSSDGGSGEILVFAASSLTHAFADIEAAYEQQNSSANVVLSFAGSSTLREQLLDGAPADVFASANLGNIDSIVDAELAKGMGPWFASNELLLAVPAGNPGSVSGIDDLVETDLAIGLCDEAVPCGLASTELLTILGVEPDVDTYEPNVAALASRVADGELDVGLVYATTIAASNGRLDSVPLPDGLELRSEYAVVPMLSATNAEGADAFIDFVVGAEGQEILAFHGFGPGTP